MTTNVFTPELPQLNSAVTPTQGVDNVGAVQLFSDIANTAMQATTSFIGQKELNSLGKKFDNIAQLRSQGGNATTLSARARTALAEMKAANPQYAQQADALFQTKFGGGSSGVFAKTAEEKAKDAYVQEVTETALQLGLTQEEAAKRITLRKDAEDAKKLADQQKDLREYNGEVLYSSTQKTLNNVSISFMDSIGRALDANGGTLSTDNKRALIATTENQKLALVSQLNAQVRDPNNGHLLISKDLYDSNLEAIDKWAEDTKRIIGDNAYAKLVVEANTAKSAEVNLMASRKYELFKVLDNAGGQNLVQAYIQGAMRGEGAAKEYLKRIHPAMSDAFEAQGSFSQAADKGFDKLMLGSGRPTPMTQNEAFAVGTILNDPANTKVTIAAVEEVSKGADKSKAFRDMIINNPDSARMMWTNTYKTWAQGNKDKAKRVGSAALTGLRSSFLGAYAKEAGDLNPDFNYVNPSNEEVANAAKVGRAGLLKSDKLRLTGKGLTPEIASIVNNARNVIESHPDVWEELNKKAGMALSLDLATRYALTDKLPEIEEPQEPTKKTLEGEEPKKKVGQDPAKKVETLDDEDDG